MYYRFVKSISFSIFLITSIYGCYVTFGVKSNQKRGGCDSPAPHKRRTSVECCACYKSRKFETSFVSLIRSTNFFAIFASIFPPASPWKSTCSPQTPLLLFGESISPNPFLFDKSQFTKQIQSELYNTINNKSHSVCCGFLVCNKYYSLSSSVVFSIINLGLAFVSE